MRETARRAPDRPPRQPDRSPAHPANAALSLQRTVGTRAARGILAREPVQADADSTQKTSSVTIPDLATVPILSWSFGSTPGTGGAGGARSESGSGTHDVHFTAHAGPFSPKLFEAVATGKHFDTAVLTSGGVTVTFRNVTLSNYVSSSGNEDALESWTLNYAGVDYKTTGGG
jgi:hypothetical protein